MSLYTGWGLMLLFIITSSLNSLLPTRALCGCVDNLLVLNMRSTGAEVAGIQKIFSNSSCKSANSFFYLTRSLSSLSSSSRFRRIVIVINILCPRIFQGHSLRTAHVSCMVFDDPRWRGLSSGTTTLSLGTLPLSLWPIALRDIWRNVF